MKKIALCILSFGLFSSLFSESASQPISAARRKFIKGSIVDKTAAVKEAAGSEPSLAESGLDFVIENQALLGNDRDIAALATASVLALPKTVPEGVSAPAEYAERLCEKLVQVFTQTADQTVAIAIIDKLVPFAAVSQTATVVTVLNTQLTTRAPQPASPVSLALLSALDTLGNSDSFSVVYAIWRNNLWSHYADEVEKTLSALSVRCASEAVKAVATGDVAEVASYFAVVRKYAKKSPHFIAEIAENVLSKTIYTVEGFSDELAELQLSALSVIAETNWTRASSLVIRAFTDAKERYAEGRLTEAQFVAIIADVAKLASPDSAAALSSYLADLNRSTQENAAPAKSVALAVISALGELGDKTAFDTLLYVTYLSYPEEVIQAAREALAHLKW